MAISGSYDFSSSRDNIIKGALRILGVLGVGQTPESDMTSEMSDLLNMIIKSWASEGLPIWLIKTQSITLTTAVNTYAIGASQTVNVAKPLKIYQVYLHGTVDNVDIPLVSLAQEQYNRLSLKTSSGQPIQYYYENLRTYGNLYLYPTPDSSTASGKTLKVVYQSPFADFDSSSDEPDIPQEGILALTYALAAEASFSVGFPAQDRRDLFMKAEQHKQLFWGSIQEEASLFFKIDRQGVY